jgi:hypothetical protein
MLLESGAAEEIGWLSAESGFAIFEADSKAAVLGLVAPFFRLYSLVVHVVAPGGATT